MIKAVITIRPKPEVLDVAGRAIMQALHGLEFTTLVAVQQGRVLTLTLNESDPQRANMIVESMCDQLLVNPLLEEHTVTLS